MWAQLTASRLFVHIRDYFILRQPVPALSEARRARQTEEHRGGRDRPRTQRVHLGHQPARDVARRTA